jgi:hypothetical protein
MRWYKDASPKMRNRSMYLFLKYKKKGLIPYPDICHICKKTVSQVKRMDWHNEEYVKSNKLLEAVNNKEVSFDDIYSELMTYIKPTCQTCHFKLHKNWMKKVDYFNNPKYKDLT